MPDSYKHISRRDVLRTAGAAGAVTMAGLAGCVGDDDDTDDTADDAAVTDDEPVGLNEIHVGVLEALSGTFSFMGDAEVEGAELAKEDLEEEFDIDIEMSVEDTEVDPDTGVSRLERLVTQGNIDVGMGGVSSAVAISMGQWASRNGIAFMAAGSHSDATTGSECARHMYRATSSNTMLARTAGSLMADHADSWFLVYSDYTWGHTARDAIRNELEAADIEVVGEIGVPLGAEDFSRALGQLEESEAAAMGNITGGADTARMTQQFFERGLHEDFEMGGPLLEDEFYTGLDKEVVENIGVWATPWSPAVQTDGTTRLMERVMEDYDRTAYSRHYIGYTGLDQLVRAAIRADSVDADDIREELVGHDYSDYGLLDGTQQWRECDNQNLKPTYGVRAKSADEMEDDPYTLWFEHIETKEADEVVRTCEETGCEF